MFQSPALHVRRSCAPLASVGLVALLTFGCAKAGSSVPDLAGPVVDMHRTVEDLAVPHLDLGDMSKETIPPDMTLPPPRALFTATPDLVGFATQLDGTASNDPHGRPLAFTWSLTDLPSCSHLGSDPFSAPGASPTPAPSPDPDGTRVQFYPDCGGTYSVTLTVTTPDHESGSITQPVVVPTAPLFLYRGHEDEATSSTEVDVLRSDGTGLHAVSCPELQPFGASSAKASQSNTPFYNLGTLGSIGLRVWEPPPSTMTATPGTLARVVFTEQTPFGDSSTVATYKLSVTDEHGDCQSEPAVPIQDPVNFTTVPKIWPRFSPAGDRVAFIDADHFMISSNQQWRLETVALDGTQRHVVHTVTSSLAPRAAPVWIDETHISWVESSSDSLDNIIYQAADADGAGDGAGRTVLLDCSMPSPSPLLSEITQYALVPTGLVVAGTNSLSGGVGIFKMGSICSTAIPLLTSVHDVVADFDISADARTLLVATSFGSDAGSSPPRDIYTLPTSGAGQLTKVGGDPLYDDFGPRFVAGGRQIAWTQLSTNIPDAAIKGGGIMVANADGTNAHSLLSQDASPTSIDEVVGGTNSGWYQCNTAGQRGGLADLALSLAVLLWLALRRRAAT